MEEQRLQGVAQLLVHAKLLDKIKTLEYQLLAQSNQQSLLQYLVINHILDAKIIAWLLANHFGVPFIDLDAINPINMPVSLVNQPLINKHAVLPIHVHGNHLFLAVDDPGQQDSLKEIQFHTGLDIHAIVVETNKLMHLINKILYEKEPELNHYIEEASDIESLGISAHADDITKDDAPIVKLVNQILIDAIKKNVSDIHFEPYEHDYRIRYRLDGLLTEIASPPLALACRMTSRIKIMSNMDISERRIPQDGRFKMVLPELGAIDCRVSTCPTVGGEKVVMRILDPASASFGIETLGFSDAQKKLFLTSIAKPQGLILVTGPTGSGKTVTLYAALNGLNTKEINISTAEDPVEINIHGINQVNINPKAGLTFSNTLRAFLRQDPDVIMVGEIRDPETANIAVTAAQTGHLVLSTLHTNSAAETLTRLINMGIPSFNIASSMNLLIAQRLVRKLCEYCKCIRNDITPESLIELGFSETESLCATVYKAVGCQRCNHGYRGRIGLFEVLSMSKTIGQIMMSGGNSIDILKQAQSEGMLTIYQSGLKQVQAGITSIEEINRVALE